MTVRPSIALLATLILAAPAVFAAQNDNVKIPAPSAAPAKTEDGDTFGTTIFGDQESPIGLYITPWKESYAERGLDRPARLFDEAIEPIDRATFQRQLAYWRELTRYRQAHATPASAQP